MAQEKKATNHHIKKLNKYFCLKYGLSFFGLTSMPRIIFKDRDSDDSFFQKASEPSYVFKENSINYLGLWDGEDKNNKSLEITLSAKCELEIVEDVNIDMYYQNYIGEYDGEEIEEEIEEELNECRNMFNFGLENLEEDEDESFDHDWIIVSI